MTKKKVKDANLEEITQPEYMRLIDQSTQDLTDHLHKIETKYMAEMNTITKYINDLHCQYRTTKMYEIDGNVKYFFNPKTGELTYDVTKRPKHIGFVNEAR